MSDRATRPASLTRPAMVGIVLLSLAYVGVFARVTDVVGGTASLLVEVALVLVVATALASKLTVRQAMWLSAVALLAGLLAYFYSVPASQRALFTVGAVVHDALALMSGLSVLRLLEARVWVLTVLPAPLFASWLLALRGRFGESSAVGGALLTFLILTGDAGVWTTLLGVVGATLAVGLGHLDVRGALDAQWDTVTLVVATMVVLSVSLSVVPGGAASPVLFGDGTPTLEGNLVSNGNNLGIVGAIELSPQVRFTVEADRQAYWRVGAYDRYTGGNWIRTGESERYDGSLSGPPGASRRLDQKVTAKSTLNAMPAAWKPVSVDGKVERATQVTDLGGLKAGTALRENESYEVTSEVPSYTTRDLREAGTDYPAEVESRYLQLPESTPQRVADRTSQVTRNASTPYGEAVAIERYLERTKGYSLSIDRPSGNIADAFLFEMDRGYCTYFATTMVVMLRTQGVPARMVTGYTPGERVGEDKWVVRGLDAHAWVEVYFPDVGWVAFDPTPASSREDAEQARIEEARDNGEPGVDTTESGPGGWTPTPTTPTATPTPLTAANGTAPSDAFRGRGSTPDLGQFGSGGDINGTAAGPPGGDEGDDGFRMPTRETLTYGAALLVGLVAAVRRFGVVERVYRSLWVRYQPRADPERDAERAYQRLEYLLEKRYRARRPGETRRDYLDALYAPDPRAVRVHEIAERARYGGRVTEAEADEAVDAVDAMVAERTPVLGRVRRAVGRWA